jgi:hypothetical protein
MNRLIFLVLVLLTACRPLHAAQSAAQSNAAPCANAPNTCVTFLLVWPDADPQWYEFVLQSDGEATYRSLPRKASAPSSNPEPYQLDFTLSPQTLRYVFELAPQLPRFQPTLDKTKVAFTGTKTLHYDNGAGDNQAISYNYSTSPELTAFTELMQGISETIECSQTLRFQSRFDKLALDATLRTMENLVSIDRLAEFQLLEPELNRIANDPTVMHIARQRARHILQAASQGRPKGK